jgi:hypothetical protein
VRGQDRVRVAAAAGLGVGVDQGGRQAGHCVEQGVLGGDGGLVGLDGGGTGADGDLALGAQLVADPAQPHLPGAEHAGSGPQHLLGLVDHGRVDGVHQPPVDLPRGLAQHGEDRHRDHQAHRRVGPVPAQRHAARPQQHRQRGEPVGAGVQPVGDQRRRPDPATGPDPVPGHQLVAREPREGGHRDRGQVGDVPRVQQAGHRLVGGQRGRRRDQGDDHDPGQVLGPPVPVGVAAVRRAPAHDERHRQRDGGQRVGGVVQRVAQQRHRPRQARHHCLHHGRGGQDAQRGPQHPQPFRAGLQRRVHLLGCLVGVRSQAVHRP